MCVIVLQRKCPLAISKWRKVKTWKTLSTFFTFFDMTLQKRKKSRFLDFEKTLKNVFSNYGFFATYKNTLRFVRPCVGSGQV